MEKEVEENCELIARCGLYCGACRKYLAGKCPGCRKNKELSWCKTRSCCMVNAYHSCADCTRDVKDCPVYSNFISKVFGFIFNSDRSACVARIQEIGKDAYACEMARKRCQTIKRK